MITSKLTQANTNYSMAFKLRKKKGFRAISEVATRTTTLI